MPVDKPKAGETEEDYLAYCIPEEIKAGNAQDVAAAICYSTYRKDKMSKIKDTSAKVMARVAYDTKFRGINLQEGGLEDACWPGWKALGTKELDGKIVPNCIPEEHPDNQ
jgi:hypothetical protein